MDIHLLGGGVSYYYYDLIVSRPDTILTFFFLSFLSFLVPYL